MTKFWIEDISNLFQPFYLIPSKTMSLEEQLNCLTRVVLLIFLIMVFVNVTYDILFLSVSLLLIIIIFYLYKNFSKKEEFIEYYGKVDTVLTPPPTIHNISNYNDFIFSSDPNPGVRSPCRTPISNFSEPLGINIDNLDNPQLIDTQSSSAWCYRDIPIQESLGASQTLVGGPNPRTLIRPIIPNPIYDFEVWLPNDFIIPTAINDQKRQEFYQNGYVVHNDIPTNYNNDFYVAEGFQNFPDEIREDYQNEYNNYANDQRYYNQDQYTNTNFPAVDKSCGYFPQNLNYNLPINYYPSPCEANKGMSEYNKNLFSIPIQPGIYTQSQVNQPYASMSNLCISMDQPFLPTTFDKEGGVLKYTEYDPSTVKQIKNPPYNSESFGSPLRNEIYDPRLTGYGTSYRSYIDEMVGQPRFYYDDIDQITRPNYITRNNLDIYGFAPRIGTPNTPSLQGDELRQYANNNYTDSQIQLRTELQQRLMHKNNNREWQQRIAPITRNNRASVGGGTMSGFYK